MAAMGQLQTTRCDGWTSDIQDPEEMDVNNNNNNNSLSGV